MTAIYRRRRQTARQNGDPTGARLARWTAAFYGLILLISVAGFAVIFTDIMPGFGVPRVYFEVTPLLQIMMVLTRVAGLLSIAVVVFAVVAWVRRFWSLGGRIFYSLLAVSALLLTWSLAYWDLLP